MKRIAVISDIHGNIVALEEIIHNIRQRRIDCVVNLGDHVSGPLWPKETIECLKQQDWIQISGNHDRQLIDLRPELHNPSDRYARNILNNEELNWFRALPSNLVIHDEILLFHGSPSNDSLYLLETIEHGRVRLATQSEINKRLNSTKSHVMLCGHTHIPRIVELSGNCLIINPGSVGLQAYDDKDPKSHIIENGSPHARYAILENRKGRWNVEFITLSYDFQKAADQARKNGRLDWEIGLQTGYMK